MTIPALTYKGFELRAYATQEFPTVHDPFAPGARRFSSVVRIDALEPGDSGHHRYQAPSSERGIPTQALALEAAVQFGKDIVDGKLRAPWLPH